MIYKDIRFHIEEVYAVNVLEATISAPNNKLLVNIVSSPKLNTFAVTLS